MDREAFVKATKLMAAHFGSKLAINLLALTE